MRRLLALLVCAFWTGFCARLDADYLKGPEEFFDPPSDPDYVEGGDDRPLPSIDIVLGRDHVQGLIYHVLVPWLNNLFGEIKIPDIDIPVISLKALTIERLALENVEVLGDRPPFAHPEVLGRPQLGVTSLTLRADTDLVASLLIGKTGGSKLTVTLNSTKAEVNVELFRDRAESLFFVSVTKIYLEDVWSKQTVRELKTDSNNWVSATLNAVIRASEGIIMGQIQDGVNNWGSSVEAAVQLTWPLDILNNLPIGPSATCMGLGANRLDRCRAKLEVGIPVLEFNSDMGLHLVAQASPYVERVHIAETVAGSTHMAAYEGTPMLHQSVDGRSANFTYSDALDLCIQEEGECESVWAELSSNGRLQYRIGRTRYPVPDSQERWQECGKEGDFCRYSDDESTFGNPETDENMWNFSAHHGHTDVHRLLRLRFGMFRNGRRADYVEKVGYDFGIGVPCRRDFFDIGKLSSTGADIYEVLGPGPFTCRRLGVLDAGVGPTGEISTLVSTIEAKYVSTDITCPLERPCITQAFSKTYCIPETADSEGNHGCPTFPPSIHAWFEKGQLPFTQPVTVAKRTKLRCTGPEHLSCWPDSLQPSPLPPALDFGRDHFLPDSQVKLSLPTDSLNSALAVVYKAGILSSQVFDLDGPVQNVSALCEITSGYLCPRSSMSDDTPVKLTVRQTMPASVTTTETGLRVSIALELLIYGWDREATGIPLQTVISPNKMCTVKEGFMTVTRKYYPTNYKKTKLRWFELVGQTLGQYTAHGRGSKKSFDLSEWTVERDDDRPECIKLKEFSSKTRKLCSESEATTEEWYTALLNAQKSPSKCEYPKLDANAARIKFGVDLDAGVDVAQNRYLCVRPHTDKIHLTHVGTLHVGSRWSATTLNYATSLGVRNLLSMILSYFGLLKPMQVWNLESLGNDMGLEQPRIEIGQNRIYVQGEVKKHGSSGEAEEAPDAGFNMADDNPCMR